jgi:hypothetical protein
MSEGKAYWMPRSSPTAADIPAGARLLPNFDEYIVGYADRSAQCGSSTASKPAAMNVLFKHTIVLGGTIVGTWRRSVQKDALTIEVEPLATLGRTERRLVVTAVEQYGRYAGKPVEIRGL